MKALRIVYGDEVIVVQCVPRQVVKGRVLIKVHPDCRVIVSVPPETPEHELSALKRGRWIYQQLRDFREQHTHCSASVCQRRKPLLSR